MAIVVKGDYLLECRSVMKTGAVASTLDFAVVMGIHSVDLDRYDLGQLALSGRAEDTPSRPTWRTELRAHYEGDF